MMCCKKYLKTINISNQNRLITDKTRYLRTKIHTPTCCTLIAHWTSAITGRSEAVAVYAGKGCC